MINSPIERFKKLNIKIISNFRDYCVSFFEKYLYNKPAIVVISLIIISIVGLSGFVSYIYDPIIPKAKAAISQTIGFKIYDESDQLVTNRTEAKPREKVEWLKQIEISDGDIDSNTISIEKIPDNQDFVPGSMEIPPGWKVQYSTTTAPNPTDNDYNWSDTEPNISLGQKVTYVRIKTDTVTTLKPTSQSPLTKPLDQEEIEAPSGMTNPKILAAKRMKDWLFVIYQAVDVSDGVNDANDMTLNCIDLLTYSACLDDTVTFPTYLSSQTNTSFGGSTLKDISTPSSLKSGYDDGSYGHEGNWYIPAQQGNNYGVNCINIKDLINCGFTNMGSSTAPNQGVGLNPTLISGFAQDGSKLYAHANYNNGDGLLTNDYLDIICFDMSTQSKCTGYESRITTNIPSLYMGEHLNEFYTTSQHLFDSGKYYFMMSYDEANRTFNNNSTPYYTQTLFGNVLVCYDTVQKNTCNGWPSRNIVYNQGESCGFLCWHYPNQPVKGSLIIPESNTASGNDLYERPHQLYFSRNNQGNITGVCGIIGLTSVSGTMGTNCFNISDGVANTSLRPPNFVPGSWKSGPWAPTTTSFEYDNKIFSSWMLIPGLNPLDPAVGRRGAMVCYDWETQAFCENYRTPHYWFEVNNVDTIESQYIPDGNCMIGVSGLDFIWSFDMSTAETPCRKVKKTVNITPQVDAARAFCDGSVSQRTPSWGYLKLNRANLYDFKEIKATIKDKNGSVVSGYSNIDIKQLPDGRLDISSIPYSGDTDELSVEFDAEIFNTSPWADDFTTPQVDPNFPLATAVMNVYNVLYQQENAQYCYKTKIKDYCDIDNSQSLSNITNLTEDDELNIDSELVIDVSQEPETQCFKDLKISVSTDKTEVKPGDDLTYTIRVENQANEDPERRGDVGNTYTEAIIPNGTTLISSTGFPSVDGDKVTWASESIFAKSYSIKTVTVKINQPTTANNSGFSSIPKALAQSNQLVFQAKAVFDDDYSQTDNSITFSGVILSESTSQNSEQDQNSPEQSDNETTDEESPSQQERNSTTPRSRGFRNQFTPEGLERFVPAPLRGFVEKMFRGLHIIVSPLPVSVAMAIPYSIISIILALAIIKIYLAVEDKKLTKKSINLSREFTSIRKLRKHCLDLANRIINSIIETGNTSSKQIYSSIVDHSSLLKIGDIGEITEFSSTKKTRLFSFSSLWMVAVIAIITLLLNSVFIWAGKYSLNQTIVLIQSSYLVLSGCLLVIASSYQKNTRYFKNIALENLNSAKLANNNESKLAEEVVLIISKDASDITDQSNKVNSKKIISTMKKLGEWNSQLDSKSTKLNQTNVSLVINKVIADLRSTTSAKKIELKSTTENELKIDLDKESLEKILKNIILLIADLLPEGGLIELNTAINNTGDQLVSVTIPGNSQILNELNNAQKLASSNKTDFNDFDKLNSTLELFEANLIIQKVKGKIDINLSQNKDTKIDIIFSKND